MKNPMQLSLILAWADKEAWAGAMMVYSTKQMMAMGKVGKSKV